MAKLKIRKLIWEHHSGNYPSWTTREITIDFEAEIDTGRALVYGKFPLFINERSKGKPNTLREAKQLAQAEFEELAREAIDSLIAKPDARLSTGGA